jgi:cysteine-rich repeat protein
MIAVGLLTLTTGGPAWADAKASAKCRSSIAKNLGGVINSGYKASDACHKAQDKASAASGQCDDPSNAGFDSSGKYAGSKSKATGKIGSACQAGDPVLGNYVGMDVTGSAYPEIEDTVGGNSLLVLGSMNLAGDKGKTRCLETIAKSRTAIVKEIIKNSTKCQQGKDKSASTFGAIDPTCVDAGSKSTGKANTKIPAACTGLTGADVGTCTPLPDCAVNATVSAAQSLARTIYQTTPPTPPAVCGNSIVETGEQCDDGANNGQPGDLCSANCESLASTCGPATSAGGTFIGTRTITVTINVPGGKQLAGAQIHFDYPQLEASIKGTGASSVVNDPTKLMLLQTAPSGALTLGNDSDTDFNYLIAAGSNFISSGPLFKIVLDNCVTHTQHICNRSQNVYGCCPSANISMCTANPDDNNSCFCTFSGSVTGAQCAAASCTSGVCPTGGTLDMATCQACGRDLPGCTDAFNPPDCAIGHFPAQADGVCSTPAGACPSNNICTDQDFLVTSSCGVSDPVDALASPVAGVTCTTSVTEP